MRIGNYEVLEIPFALIAVWLFISGLAFLYSGIETFYVFFILGGFMCIFPAIWICCMFVVIEKIDEDVPKVKSSVRRNE